MTFDKSNPEVYHINTRQKDILKDIQFYYEDLTNTSNNGYYPLSSLVGEIRKPYQIDKEVDIKFYITTIDGKERAVFRFYTTFSK